MMNLFNISYYIYYILYNINLNNNSNIIIMYNKNNRSWVVEKLFYNTITHKSLPKYVLIINAWDW